MSILHDPVSDDLCRTEKTPAGLAHVPQICYNSIKNIGDRPRPG